METPMHTYSYKCGQSVLLSVSFHVFWLDRNGKLTTACLSRNSSMDEEPHAHEKLVAKASRQSGNDLSGNSFSGNGSSGNSSSGSKDCLTESGSQIPALSNEQISGSVETAENQCVSMRSFLLEPMILILLFAYNFSCKLCNCAR